eukprot:jgi/Mesen1/686/ME000109S_10910
MGVFLLVVAYTVFLGPAAGVTMQEADYTALLKLRESFESQDALLSWEAMECDSPKGYPVYQQWICFFVSSCLYVFGGHARPSHLQPATADLHVSLLAALGGNGFSGALPQGLCRSKKLTRLSMEKLARLQARSRVRARARTRDARISENRLLGLIPSCIGQLPALTALNLKQNQFSGSVSPQLCLLKKLTSLHLGSNQLSGDVPSCLPALPRLRSCESLSGNYLAGSGCPLNSDSASNCFSAAECAQAQRSAEECASFCGSASLKYGPCGAHGRCFLSGTQPTCACQPGYKSARVAGVASCTRPSGCTARPPPSMQSASPPPASKAPPPPAPARQSPPPPSRSPALPPPAGRARTPSPHARGLLLPFGGRPLKYLNRHFRHASFGFSGDANASDWGLQPSMDWRQQGVLPPVKEQGRCGASWAFAAVGAIEAATANLTSRQVAASGQQVIDCQRVGSTCAGGWPGYAFEYAAENTAKCYGGLASESDYPYIGIRNKRGCNLVAVDFHGVLGLLLAVQSQPVVVHLETDQDSFVNYSGTVRGSPFLPLALHASLLAALTECKLAESDLCGSGAMNPCGGGACIPSGRTNKCRCPPGFAAVTNLDGSQTCAPGELSLPLHPPARRM